MNIWFSVLEQQIYNWIIVFFFFKKRKEINKKGEANIYIIGHKYENEIIATDNNERKS